MGLAKLAVGGTNQFLLTDTALRDHAEVVTLMPGQLTAFGWLRTAAPATLFDSAAQYGDNAVYWETKTNGAGSAVANVLADSAVRLTTGAANGAFSRRQTRTFWRYQPGKGQLILNTFVLGTAQTNLVRRIGYFCDTHGIFLEQTDQGLFLVIRKGSAVAERVAQAAWNVDPMTGTGRSGVLLDVTKTQILAISLEWLGVGTAAVGFFIDGTFIPVHAFHHANSFSSVYMESACLPVRGEILASGALSGTATMDMICASVISEGGFADALGPQYAVGNGTVALAVTVRRPILSLRAKTTGPNAVVNRGQIKPKTVTGYVAGNVAVYYEIVLNGTLTNASWAAAGNLAEFDVAATAIAGGTVIDAGYIPSSAQTKGLGDASLLRDFPLVYTEQGSVQDILTLVMTSMGAATSGAGDIVWQELF